MPNGAEQLPLVIQSQKAHMKKGGPKPQVLACGRHRPEQSPVTNKGIWFICVTCCQAPAPILGYMSGLDETGSVGAEGICCRARSLGAVEAVQTLKSFNNTQDVIVVIPGQVRSDSLKLVLSGILNNKASCVPRLEFRPMEIMLNPM